MNLTITCVMPIDDTFVNNIQNHILNYQNQLTSVTLSISSPGGSVNSGITAYNYLKQLEFPVYTHNLGEVSSAAILPYLAGSKRTAERFSKFMLHPVEIQLSGSWQYHKVAEVLSNLDIDIDNYSSIVKSEAPLLAKKYDVSDLLKHESLVLSPERAKAFGIVTE